MKYKLRDLSINKNGSYGLGASAIPFISGNPEYLRITDISDDGTIPMLLDTSIDIEKYPNYKNYLLRINDIVIARTGNSTGRNYMLQDENRKLIYAGFLVKFSINPSKIIPGYVKYFFQTEDYKSQIKSLTTGSTRNNINAKQFGNIEIPALNLKIQQHIVDTI